MTDGNTYAINKHLDEREDYDALQEVTAELEQAEIRIEELEANLAKARADWFEMVFREINLKKKAVEQLERLGFDFQSIVGRELKGQNDE